MRGSGAFLCAGLLLLGACGQDKAREADDGSGSIQPLPQLAAASTKDSIVAETVSSDDAPGVDEGTLCAGAESVVFSCTLANGKIASVCGSNPDTKPAYAEYRLARPGETPEISLPKKGEKPHFARVGYSGGGAQQLIYASGAYRYVVFSSMTRNFKGPEGSGHDFEAGVAVLRGDKQISKQMCVSPADEDIRLHDEAAAVVSDDFEEAFIYLE